MAGICLGFKGLRVSSLEFRVAENSIGLGFKVSGFRRVPLDTKGLLCLEESQKLPFVFGGYLLALKTSKA